MNSMEFAKTLAVQVDVSSLWLVNSNPMMDNHMSNKVCKGIAHSVPNSKPLKFGK